MLTLADGSSAITGLHRAYKTDGTEKTINAESTYLYDVSSAGVQTAIDTGLTDGKWWSFVTYKDKAIGTNGYDQPIKWDLSLNVTANTDAHRTAGYLVADLGAPFVELNTGTTLTASRYFAYMVAFYDGTSYTYSTARSNPILTGTTVRSLYLTDIPIGPVGTTHRYIFRTPAHTSMANVIAEADADFLMVKDLADNTTTVWADDVAVGSEPDSPNWAAVTAGTDITPPKCKYALIHRERLFLAGNPSYPSYVYWSDEYNPDYFGASDYEKIREDDGDAITFIKEQLGVLTVGKENSILKFYTDAASESDWYPSNIISHTGCPAPYSVANSPLGIIYLGRGGIYRFDGQNSSLISDAVTPEIEDILETNVDEASGYFWKNQYYFAYTSLESGESENNRVLIYDMVRDAYTMDYKNVNRWCAFGGGTDYGVLYSGDSTSDGYIYAQEGAAEGFGIKLKSQFNAGTFDDTRVYGTETSPVLEIAWDCTIDGWLTELQTKDANISDIDSIVTYLADATIDRPDGDGTWTSPGYEINAQALQEVKWNEDLGTGGNVTVAIRLASTEAGLSSASYCTALTDPNGSDVSSVTANAWVQFLVTMTTSDTAYTPTVYVSDGYAITMSYAKSHATYESAYDSIWQSGWSDLGAPGIEKRIKRIRIFYSGDNGTLTFNFKNEEQDIDTSFNINLGIDPYFKESDTDNTYEGTADEKVYTYYTTDNEEGLAPIGQFWQFKISENGDYDNLWAVSRIEILYEPTTLY